MLGVLDMSEDMKQSHRARFTPHSIEDILRNTGEDGEVDKERMRESDEEYREYLETMKDNNKQYLQLEGYIQTGRGSEYEGRISPGKSRREGREEEGIPRRKKMRTTFTGIQIFELEKMFETKKYLNASERTQLSRCINSLS